MFPFLLHLFSRVKYSHLYYVWAFLAVILCNSLLTDGSSSLILSRITGYSYRVFSIILFLLFPLYLAQKRKMTLYYDKYVILVLMFMGSAFLSFILNSPSKETFSMMVMFYVPAIISILFIQTGEAKAVERMFIAFIAFGLINSILSFISLFSSGFSLLIDHSVIFADRNLYCRFLCIMFIFVFSGFMYKDKKKSLFRWELFVSLIIVSQILYMLSRSGYILFISALLVIILSLTNRKLKIILLCLTIVFGALSTIMVAKRISQDRMAVADYSDLHRINLIRAGLKMIESSPVIGIGYGQSQIQFKNFMVKDLPGIEGVRAIHNCYIHVFAEQGIIGLVIFLLLNGGLLFSQYKIIRKKHFPDKYLHITCFVSIMVFMLQGFVYHSFENEGVYWLIVAANIMTLRDYRKKTLSQNSQP